MIDPGFSLFGSFWQALGWPLRRLGEVMGISPNLVLSFDRPFNNAVIGEATFIMLPLDVRRQHWWGDTRPLEDCAIRLRLQGERELNNRLGVWYSSNANHFYEPHIRIFEGYARFDIPLVVQHCRESYWHDDATAGTYLADLSFMNPNLTDCVKLKEGRFHLDVDVVAGPKIRATSRWLIMVETMRLGIGRAWSDVTNLSEGEIIWFRLEPQQEP